MTSNFIKINSHLLVLIFFIACLSACQPYEQLSDDLQDYQQRLARVLESEKPAFIVGNLPAYPPLKTLENTLSQPSIKLSEFYQLQHCQLATLVAERNTSLGKLQLPSTRFHYEKQLIRGLQECIKQTQQPDLKEHLQAWLHIKQQNLVLSWADMLQKSTEMRQALSTNQGLIAGSPQDGLNETVAAFIFLLASQQQDVVDLKALERHLYNLAQFALPARLWRSQHLLADNLNLTTLWLKQRGANDFCVIKQPQINAKDIEYLSNVFQLFFIEKIQPDRKSVV